jgi:hypothetical protein
VNEAAVEKRGFVCRTGNNASQSRKRSPFVHVAYTRFASAFLFVCMGGGGCDVLTSVTMKRTFD